MNGVEMADDAALTAGLKAVIAKTDNKRVIIEGDKETMHGDIVRVMGLARDAGADKLAISTIPESGRRHEGQKMRVDRTEFATFAASLVMHAAVLLLLSFFVVQQVPRRVALITDVTLIDMHENQGVKGEVQKSVGVTPEQKKLATTLKKKIVRKTIKKKRCAGRQKPLEKDRGAEGQT